MTTPTDVVREKEQADAAKTADDAPAPVRPPEERKVLVRDAHGNDPHGGEPDEPDLSKSPYERPAPAVVEESGTAGDTK
jgi:hypothetical protein